MAPSVNVKDRSTKKSTGDFIGFCIIWLYFCLALFWLCFYSIIDSKDTNTIFNHQTTSKALVAALCGVGLIGSVKRQSQLCAFGVAGVAVTFFLDLSNTIVHLTTHGFQLIENCKVQEYYLEYHTYCQFMAAVAVHLFIVGNIANLVFVWRAYHHWLYHFTLERPVYIARYLASNPAPSTAQPFMAVKTEDVI